MSLKQLTKTIKQISNLQQNPNHYVQNYHKLIKMKKLLADTEQKMFNRIKLFQKASEKVLKKKQNENNFFSKFQQLKKKDQSFIRNQQRSKTRQELQRPKTQQKLHRLKHMHSNQNLFEFIVPLSRESEIKHCIESPPKKVLIERINQERIKNARMIKQDRQRNKIIIEQRKKKQLTRKLQSANQIRRQREKAKIIKQQMTNQKHQEYRKYIQQKYSKEKQQFTKIQFHLQQLQQKEKQALITWKRTIEADKIQLFDEKINLRLNV